MPLADKPRAAARLQVEKKRARESQRSVRIHRNSLLQAGADRAIAHFVERVTIPPTLHVGLAKSERATRQHRAEETCIIHANIPRTPTIKLNVGQGKKVFNRR